MSGKVVISGVSLILVVGVAIGVVVVVNKKDSGGEIASHQKSVRAMCDGTEDPKLCQDAMSNVKEEGDPKAYIAAGVEATVKSVVEALNMSDRLRVEHGNKDSGVKMALDDCKDLIEFAMDSIEASANLIHRNDIQALHDQTADFKNWLSSIISYQQSCMDGFNNETNGEEEIKKVLHTGSLDNMGKLSGIVLDIVSNLTKILENFDLKLNLNPASRRLLDVDSEGLPTWLSAADRKLLADNPAPPPPPNVVVAKDGSGQFKTVKEAIASYPKKHEGRFVIYVKAGVYDEYILIPKKSANIYMYGDGTSKTIITGSKNFADGVKTMQTATFANAAPGFIARSIAFENTAGAKKHQAVAFRNQGDMSACYDCAMRGYQDTLYVHANRQFYRNCEISGTIDFIFGASTALIQNSKIIVRLPEPKQFNTVTADGTSQRSMSTGIVIQNCEIMPEKELFPQRLEVKSYLGRPWKEYSKTVIMESNIGDLIQPEGWIPWDDNLTCLNTLYYGEFANTGLGANTQGRVKWSGYAPAMTREIATLYTAQRFLQAGPNGITEEWLKPTELPFDLGFTKP